MVMLGAAGGGNERRRGCSAASAPARRKEGGCGEATQANQLYCAQLSPMPNNQRTSDVLTT